MSFICGLDDRSVQRAGLVVLRAAGPQGAPGAGEPWCQSGAVLSCACFVLLLEKEKGNEVGGRSKSWHGNGCGNFHKYWKVISLKKGERWMLDPSTGRI